MVSFAANPADRMGGGSHVRQVERLSCMSGTEDRQARIAVEMVNGSVKSFAYYSKRKPRTCSVSVARDDADSRWQDRGRFTVVRTGQGIFLIENRGRGVHFLFSDVDRAFYCGMEPGTITGTVTVTRGNRACRVRGLMDAHNEQ